jgi:hypothetical protein
MKYYQIVRNYFSKPGVVKDSGKIKLISPRTFENARDLAEILKENEPSQPSRTTKYPMENYTAFDLCYKLPSMKRAVFVQIQESNECIISLKAQGKKDLKDLAYQLSLPNPLTFWENLTIPLEQIQNTLSNIGKEFMSKEFTQP